MLPGSSTGGGGGGLEPTGEETFFVAVSQAKVMRVAVEAEAAPDEGDSFNTGSGDTMATKPS